jgi:hypothetical protein
MRDEDLSQLTHKEFLTMMLSMMVRNKMEDFHCEHLSDDQMAELNPIIREGIMQGLLALEDDSEGNMKLLRFMGMMIPDYWEIPEEKLKPY